MIRFVGDLEVELTKRTFQWPRQSIPREILLRNRDFTQKR